MDVRWGDRVLITGANGSGKSTLLAALMGELPLTAGKRRLGPGIRIGFMDQNRDAFVDDHPLEAIEQLESALTEFSGTVILVSHDRRLIEAFRPTHRIEL